MLKRVLNTELEKKVFEDEMMEKLSVVPAEYEVYEEYASRQENFDKDFFTYCNKTPLLVDADESSKCSCVYYIRISRWGRKFTVKNSSDRGSKCGFENAY